MSKLNELINYSYSLESNEMNQLNERFAKLDKLREALSTKVDESNYYRFVSSMEDIHAGIVSDVIPVGTIEEKMDVLHDATLNGIINETILGIQHSFNIMKLTRDGMKLSNVAPQAKSLLQEVKSDKVEGEIPLLNQMDEQQRSLLDYNLKQVYDTHGYSDIQINDFIQRYNNGVSTLVLYKTLPVSTVAQVRLLESDDTTHVKDVLNTQVVARLHKNIEALTTVRNELLNNSDVVKADETLSRWTNEIDELNEDIAVVVKRLNSFNSTIATDVVAVEATSEQIYKYIHDVSVEEVGSKYVKTLLDDIINNLLPSDITGLNSNAEHWVSLPVRDKQVLVGLLSSYLKNLSTLVYYVVALNKLILKYEARNELIIKVIDDINIHVNSIIDAIHATMMGETIETVEPLQKLEPSQESAFVAAVIMTGIGIIATTGYLSIQEQKRIDTLARQSKIDKMKAQDKYAEMVRGYRTRNGVIEYIDPKINVMDNKLYQNFINKWGAHIKNSVGKDIRQMSKDDLLSFFKNDYNNLPLSAPFLGKLNCSFIADNDTELVNNIIRYNEELGTAFYNAVDRVDWVMNSGPGYHLDRVIGGPNRFDNIESSIDYLNGMYLFGDTEFHDLADIGKYIYNTRAENRYNTNKRARVREYRYIKYPVVGEQTLIDVVDSFEGGVKNVGHHITFNDISSHLDHNFDVYTNIDTLSLIIQSASDLTEYEFKSMERELVTLSRSAKQAEQSLIRMRAIQRSDRIDSFNADHLIEDADASIRNTINGFGICIAYYNNLVYMSRDLDSLMNEHKECLTDFINLYKNNVR